MIKVLIVGMTEGVGGIETFICNLKKNISSDIHMDFLVHQDINVRYLDEIQSNNSNIIKVTGIKKNFFKYLKEIFSFYKNNKYDVVHINECDAKMFFYAIPLLFERKTKVIVHSHSSSTENALIHTFLKFFQNKRANVKWACSEIAFEYMFGKKEKKVIIHNGIDLKKFKFNNSNRIIKRKELEIKDELVFCSIARFTKEKNHEKIVDIFNEYTKINPKCKLLLIGTGPLQDSIKEKVNSLNITEKVMFLNSRSDISEILSAIDIFLLPSIFEGLPFVSLEGQACAVTFFASTNVSKEIAITDLVHFVDLNASSKLWANKINVELNKKINREDNLYHQKIKEAGFDIAEVCKTIEKNYKE